MIRPPEVGSSSYKLTSKSAQEIVVYSCSRVEGADRMQFQSKNRYVCSILRGIAALGIFLSILPFVSRAQTDETDALFQAVPFNQWVAEGPKEELPWQARILPPALSFHQRIIARLEVVLDGNDVAKQCCSGRAVALLQITDFQGQIFRNYGVQDIKSPDGQGQYTFTLSWDVFLLPGDYQVVMALYYAGKPHHSLTLQKLHVHPIKDDPLPEAWRNLPNVEFCEPESEGVDKFLLPGVTGQLNLPIKNHRPIQLEILENLTPYLAELKRTQWYEQELSLLLPLLKSLSQMELTNGSVDVATMDFTRSRVTFEQKNVPSGHLDLAGLKDALDGNPITILNILDYGDLRHYGNYFAQEITQRLNAEPLPSESPNNRAVRVLIIVSGRMELGIGPEPTMVLPKDSNFVVFYLRLFPLPPGIDFNPSVISGSVACGVPVMGSGPDQRIIQLEGEQSNDGIGKALKDLKPRVYTAGSEENVREAMAAIIRELSQM